MFWPSPQLLRATYLAVDTALFIASAIDRTKLFPAQTQQKEADEVKSTTPAEWDTNAKTNKRQSKSKSHQKKQAKSQTTSASLQVAAKPSKPESFLVRIFADNLPVQLTLAAALFVLTIIQIADLVYLRPETFSDPLSSTQIRGAGLSLCLIGLRLWAMATLGAHFTFTVSKPPALIETGPYEHLVHPSYTGIIGWTVFRFSFLMDKTGPVLMCALRGFNRWRESEWAVTAGLESLQDVEGLMDLMWLVSVVSSGVAIVGVILGIVVRIRYEDAQLRAMFGDKFDKFRAARWKVIPFIY
ncbi:hypothetical protein BJ741DRAFT_621473 [Chytriomyces cf. hyalinus JEL632]|nr:hypothetical protein BJ741DRAFT_621473 [Chytriomyces cf. hyalinus JEL632]